MLVLQSAVGLVAFMFLAHALRVGGRGRFWRAVPWRLILVGVGAQVAIALVLLRVPFLREVFKGINGVALALTEATEAGTRMVFGYLGGGALPFDATAPQHGYILAFRALPLILVISALSAVLTHLRILPIIVKGFGRVLQRLFGISGAAGLGTAAGVFVGMVEAPLFVRPYLKTMSQRELLVLMTVGMATIAGTVLVLYAGVLAPVIPDAAGHLVVASVMSAPAAVTMALLMGPANNTGRLGRGPKNTGDLDVADIPRDTHSVMDAVTQGTANGLSLSLSVAATLIVLVALVHLVNLGLGLFPDVAGQPISLQRLFGYLMAPLVWLMGIPIDEALIGGGLMGTKTVINEFLGYMGLAGLPPEALSPRSRLILSYALCGFANFGSLGILLGGLKNMVPERTQEILRLGWRALVGGTLATCATGAVIGIVGG